MCDKHPRLIIQRTTPFFTIDYNYKTHKNTHPHTHTQVYNTIHYVRNIQSDAWKTEEYTLTAIIKYLK